MPQPSFNPSPATQPLHTPRGSFILGKGLVPTSCLSSNGASGRCHPWPPHRGSGPSLSQHPPALYSPCHNLELQTCVYSFNNYRPEQTCGIRVCVTHLSADRTWRSSAHHHHHCIQHPSIMDHVPRSITITASSIHPSWTTCHVPSPSLHPASIRYGPRATFQAKCCTHLLSVLTKPLGSSQLSTHFTYKNTEVSKRQARTCTHGDEPTTALTTGQGSSR